VRGAAGLRAGVFCGWHHALQVRIDTIVRSDQKKSTRNFEVSFEDKF
jgi:hypothetical protein